MTGLQAKADVRVGGASYRGRVVVRDGVMTIQGATYYLEALTRKSQHVWEGWTVDGQDVLIKRSCGCRAARRHE